MQPRKDTSARLARIALSGLMIFFLLQGPGSVAIAGGGSENDALRRLHATGRDNRAGLDAITRTVEQQTRGAIPKIVHIWKTGDANASWKSAYILGRLGDAANALLLEAGAPVDPHRQAWRLKRLTQAHLDQREAIVRELVRQLGNRTIISSPAENAPMEDPTPEQRLCDVAYLNLRQLLHTAEKPEDQLDSARIFRRLEHEARDSVIRRYTQFGVWSNLLGEAPFHSGNTGAPPPPRSME